MEKIKAILVDDEPEARDILSSLLADFSEVDILSKDASVDEAYQSVRKYQPDIVFLDIDMPGKDGFELIRMLKTSHLNPTVIFITAYNQFAIDAIRHAAFDYLLKPVDIDELSASINRYREEKKNNTSLRRIEDLLQAMQVEKIRFNSRTGSVYLDPGNIIYCQADGNYSVLHLAGNATNIVTMNIGRLENQLPVDRFVKISRSLIINRHYLSEVNRKEKACILKDGDREISLPISAKFITALSSE